MKFIFSVLALLVLSGQAAAQGFIPKAPHCAILYGNADFQQMGSPHPGIYILEDNERHEKLKHPTWGKFNDKVSAAAVRPGCILTLYLHDYFRIPLQIIEGPAAVTHANGSLIHNDEASSAECICPEDF